MKLKLVFYIIYIYIGLLQCQMFRRLMNYDTILFLWIKKETYAQYLEIAKIHI